MKLLKGQVAAVTGAASGIGRELAVLLTKRGLRVALADIDKAGLAETQRRCGAALTSVHVLDVSDREAVFQWRDEVLRTHGRCDMVVNNAGISLVAPTVAEVTPEDFRRIVDINFWGVVHGTQAFLRHFMEQPATQEYCIVNISSVFGLMGVRRNGPYCATKFAVRGLTESLRAELDCQGRTNILALSVHPGGIDTGIAKKGIASERKIAVGEAEARRLRLPPGVREVDADVLKAKASELLRKPPAEAAQVIMTGIERGSHRVLIGADAWLIDKMVRTLPVSYTYVTAWIESLQEPGVVRRMLMKLAILAALGGALSYAQRPKL